VGLTVDVGVSLGGVTGVKVGVTGVTVGGRGWLSLTVAVGVGVDEDVGVKVGENSRRVVVGDGPRVRLGVALRLAVRLGVGEREGVRVGVNVGVSVGDAVRFVPCRVPADPSVAVGVGGSAPAPLARLITLTTTSRPTAASGATRRRKAPDCVAGMLGSRRVPLTSTGLRLRSGASAARISTALANRRTRCNSIDLDMTRSSSVEMSTPRMRGSRKESGSDTRWVAVAGACPVSK
jgi:hypothetical protein